MFDVCPDEILVSNKNSLLCRIKQISQQFILRGKYWLAKAMECVDFDIKLYSFYDGPEPYFLVISSSIYSNHLTASC